MPKLMIVVGSVREGRIGPVIAEWVRKTAEADGRFDIDVADLAEIDLPMMDEPNHPRMKQYTKPHTIAWSERVEAADAFVFAFPEYNYSYSGAFKNALDYLVSEWNRKPVALVNWGGNSGGTRAQTAIRPVLAALGLVATKGSIEINFPQQQIADGVFTPNEQQASVVQLQLDELITLDEALHPLR
ncbi:MAG: NADPH-dependent FMN reductase [Gordonia sp. (in: high G+C Gram-positive bacteria)]|uniref:NADPH-dependent FMN reductase n=1 Tax=Gordonia sp. (in: high G+C Gram-positive bacteria) TaxID=84139 RepID=UPI0039E2ACA4